MTARSDRKPGTVFSIRSTYICLAPCAGFSYPPPSPTETSRPLLIMACHNFYRNANAEQIRLLCIPFYCIGTASTLINPRTSRRTLACLEIYWPALGISPSVSVWTWLRPLPRFVPPQGSLVLLANGPVVRAADNTITESSCWRWRQT